MGEKDETASPDAKPPEEPQRTVHSEPEEPADHGPPAGGDDSGGGSPAGAERD